MVCYHGAIMTKSMLSRLPPELHARVKAEAKSRNVSMNQIVIEALEMYFASVFLSAHIAKSPGQVVFTFQDSEVEKLRSFEEVIDEVINEGNDA